jgi:Kef-type K+ transport system membrane component KefB
VGRQLAFIVLLAGSAICTRAIVRRLPPADRWYAGLIWLLVCGLGADWCGLHYMVGAFLAGATLDGEWFDRQQMDWMRHHVLLLVMPVFFLSTGLRTHWALGSGAVFAAAALLLVMSVAGKLLGVWLAGRILGWQPGEGLVIGWLLQTKALIMIIFVNILLDKGLITSDMFTALLLMAIASTMLTIPAVSRRLPALLARR